MWRGERRGESGNAAEPHLRELFLIDSNVECSDIKFFNVVTVHNVVFLSVRVLFDVWVPLVFFEMRFCFFAKFFWLNCSFLMLIDIRKKSTCVNQPF